MAEYSSRTSDSNDSARVNIVTAFFDFMAFFRFTGGPLSLFIAQTAEVHNCGYPALRCANPEFLASGYAERALRAGGSSFGLGKTMARYP
jgi:hypothetical protein